MPLFYFWECHFLIDKIQDLSLPFRIVNKKLKHIIFLPPGELLFAEAVGGSKERTNHNLIDYNRSHKITEYACLSTKKRVHLAKEAIS